MRKISTAGSVRLNVRVSPVVEKELRVRWKEHGQPFFSDYLREILEDHIGHEGKLDSTLTGLVRLERKMQQIMDGISLMHLIQEESQRYFFLYAPAISEEELEANDVAKDAMMDAFLRQLKRSSLRGSILAAEVNATIDNAVKEALDSGKKSKR